MPRGRRKKIKPELQVKQSPDKQSPQELEEYVREANEVHQLTSMKGWHILKRDLAGFKEGIIAKLAYINPKRLEFDELRILFLSADKLVSMVEDYEVNRDKAVEYLNKLNNPELAIGLDVDNE